MLKKALCVLSIILLLTSGCLVSACNGNSSAIDCYALAQEEDQIVRIELMRLPKYDAPVSEYILLTEIAEAQWGVFLDSLMVTPCKKISHDPSSGVGQLAICIKYANGSAEVIGDCNGLYFYNDHCVIKGYRYNKQLFRALFEDYVSEENLPKVIDGYWENEYPFS